LDPILIHDLDGIVVDANDAACHLTGYPIDELMGMNIRLLESRYVEPDPNIMKQLMKGASFKIYGMSCLLFSSFVLLYCNCFYFDT
jgi:PAS domain S-box-containing protein